GCAAQDYAEFVATERDELIRQLDSLNRRDAAERLGRMGSLAAPAVPRLIELLHEDEEGRLTYVVALGKIRDGSAVQPIAELLARERHGNRPALRVMCEALGKLETPQIIQPLLDLLKRDEFDDVEMPAILAIANFVSNHPETLVGILEDESSWDVVSQYLRRWWSPDSARSRREPIRDELQELLNSPLPYTRAGALRLIALFPDLARQDGTKARIQALLPDTDIRVQLEAARVAVLLEDRAAIEPLLGFLESEDSELRVRAVQSLGVSGKGSADVVDRLLPILTHSDEEFRGAAARALGDLGAAAAFDDLLVLAESGTSDDKSNAAYALGV
ncbi:MAG: HEAT repeat domain-containing protein, partial [Candidatus Hydrogenedentota bacterium]